MKLAYRRLSAEDVLAVLNEDYRQQCANGDAACGSTLTLDSTISYWHGALIADDWRYDQVGVYLNGLFDTHFSKATWHAALRPYRRTRLRSVCELIASQAVVADIRPIRILGRECLAAGAFKAIRERLAAAGADVSDLRPSTSLSEFTCRNFEEMYCELIRLAPRRIPEMKCVMPPNLAARRELKVFVFVLLADCAFAAFGLALAALLAFAFVLVAVFAYAGSCGCSQWPPKRVEFGEMTTFRDLSNALVAG